MKIDFKFVPSFKTENSLNLNKSIYFMHIPKSGGTTIDYIFAEISKVLNYFKFKKYKHDKKLLDTNKIKLNSINKTPYFISGHLNSNFTKNIDNIYKCTVVREPIQRVVSHYKFMVFKKNITPNEYSFEQFIQDEVKNRRDNLITRHFANSLAQNKVISDIEKKIALLNIDYFDNITTVLNWDAFVSNILTFFNLPSVVYSRYQQHVYNFSYTPNEKDINLIKKNFKYDFDIYSKILNKKYNFYKKNKDNYNKKICLVSPYIKSNNKLYTEKEIKNLFSSNKNAI